MAGTVQGTRMGMMGQIFLDIEGMLLHADGADFDEWGGFFLISFDSDGILLNAERDDFDDEDDFSLFNQYCSNALR